MYHFIDVEASGFGAGSYPIEVGVALANGSLHCSLIRPLPHWQHWRDDAEAVHGITRESLLVSGRSPLEVALLLNRCLDGQIVYTDAWGNDSCWLGLLFEESGVRQRFRLESIVTILTPAQMERWQQTKQQVIADSQLDRHRASQDALILQRTYCELTDQKIDNLCST